MIRGSVKSTGYSLHSPVSPSLSLPCVTVCLHISTELYQQSKHSVNLLTPNDPYMGRTAPLTSKRCILCIYSTNTGTEYFKNGLYSPFFSLQNAVCFIMLTCLVPVLFTFYIQSVLKLKKNNSGAKGLNYVINPLSVTDNVSYF